MALSDVRITVRDGALATVTDEAENVCACIGYCTAGQEFANIVYDCEDPQSVSDQLVGGDLAEAVAYHVDAAKKGPVYAVPVSSDVAGSMDSPFAIVGLGPAITSSSSPNNDYALQVQIVSGGVRGTATFKYSSNGGSTWSGNETTAATYDITADHVVLAFADGIYVTDEVYETTCVKGTLTSPFSKSGSGPALTSTSKPTASAALKIKIIAGGGRGTATFEYSLDNGSNYNGTPIQTAATYTITALGVVVAFADDTYVQDEVYSSTVVAGTLTSPLAIVGAGPNITSSSVPNDNYDLDIMIVDGGTATTLSGGDATFEYSLDGGNTYSDVIAVAPTYAIPSTDVTVAFAAGTYVAGQVYNSKCVGPSFSPTNMGVALDALIDSGVDFALLHIVGAAANASGAAAMVTAVQSKLAAAMPKYKFVRAIVDMPDVADSDLVTAFAAVDADRVVAAPGYVDLVSSLNTPRIYKRPAAWPAMARAISVKPHRHLGAVEDGPLYNVRALYRDEATTTLKLMDSRFLTLRSRGRNRFYVEQPLTMALKSSDYAPLHNGRVMDKACRIAHTSLEPYVNVDWIVQADGTLAEYEARAIESKVLSDLVNNLLAGSAAEKNASAILFSVSRKEKVVTSQKLPVTIRMQPKAYSRWIDLDIGFTKTVPAPAI